jgi:hypothetical protein
MTLLACVASVYGCVAYLDPNARKNSPFGDAFTQASSSSEYSPPKSSDWVRSGERGRAPRDMIICVDQSAHDEYYKALRTNDEYGLAELLAAGRTFQIRRGNDLLITERWVYLCEVRVESGPQMGRKGIVSVDHLER